MLTATLRSLLGHKLRLALTAIAVVLGVAFVCGTFVLTDTLNATFDRIFANANAGVAVTVKGKPLAVGGDRGEQQRSRLSQSTLDTVRAIDGVADAQGRVQREASVLDSKHEPVGTGAPSFGINWIANQTLSPYHLRSGTAPHGEGEVALDLATAGKAGVRVGDRVAIVPAGGGVRTFTVSGLFSFGSSGKANSTGGATFAAFETPVAQALLDARGQYDLIDVQSKPRVLDTALRDKINAALGGREVVSTGADSARDASQQIEKALSFFGTFLLVFAVIALFVGCFIIVNTFSILVVQRSREFALLRALGATRRQVLASVLTEALITGLVASAIGCAAGILLAVGLDALLGAVGVNLPSDGLVVRPRTVIIGIVLGTAVTVLSAILPARRATRVSPVAAMREAVPETQPVTGRRLGVGGVVLTLGLALIVLGLFRSSSSRLQELGAGILLSFVGVASLAPVIVRPLAGAIGWPAARLRGVPGRLARENAQRSPRRTASTAAALMVGLALVSAISVLSASFRDSLADQVGSVQKADLQISPKRQGGGARGFSPSVAQALRGDSRLRDVEELRFSRARVGNANADVLAVDPAHRAQTVGVDAAAGDPGRLSDATVLVSESAASAHAWQVGSAVPLQLQDGTTVSLAVAAIFRANGLLGDYVISLPLYERHYQLQLDQLVLVNGARGQPLADTRRAVDSHLTAFPTLQAQDREQFVKQQEGGLNTLLGLIYGLLFLSLVIAVLGIVNTLALSVIERTRELGLLRALGLTRAQTRSMVRWEAVTIALIGSVLGIVIGIALGAAVVHALHDQGITSFAVSGTQVALTAVFGFLAGILAAVFPALRASRLRLLDALAMD
ncbi:MAG: ABC transporter permease [Candidatus Dormibacteria bacterium]